MTNGNAHLPLLAPPSLRHVPILGLSVLAAFVVSLVEVAIRLATSHETFTTRQIGLALSSQFALLGFMAVIIRALLLPITRSKGEAPSRWQRFACLGSGMLITGLLLLATDGAGVRPEKSGLPAIAGMAFSAVCLTILLNRVARSALVRKAVLFAWMICVAGSGVAGYSTWQHLAPFTHATSAANRNVTDRANILLFVLDTLRYDRFGAHGAASLTPNLDRLAKESIVYTQAISSAPWTLPMHASLFTGLYASQHGVSWGHYELDGRHPVLAELLQARGYSTFGISNNWLLSRANGFARGFEEFLETPNDPHIVGWRLAAQSAFAKTLLGLAGIPDRLGEDAGSAWTHWLLAGRLRVETAKPGPFFGFVNYFECHDPYHPPAAYLASHLSPSQRQAYRHFQQRQDDLCAHACGQGGAFTPDQIELMAALYDAEVAYQDEIVGDLLSTMRGLGLLENTWVIVTSDHGELFGESNMVFHTAGAHYQLLHIPLMVRPPGGVAAKVVDTPVQPVDIFHTLTEIAGAELPVGVTRSYALPMDDHAAKGRTLCISETFGASVTGLYVTQYRNMQADVTRWLRWVTSVYEDDDLLELDDRGPTALYDVRLDPGMKNNLVEKRQDRVKELLSRYWHWSGNEHSKGPL